MSAVVTPQLAMEPGIRTIQGYQAMCNEDSCAEDEIGVWGGEENGWMRWCGTWRTVWFDARLDALLHDIEQHGVQEEVVWPL